MDQDPLTTAADTPAPGGDDGGDGSPAQAPDSAAPTGFGSRGRARRRARFLRRARELAYRDLGGLVFNLHRFGQRNDELVLAKLTTLGHIDAELRAIEDALGRRRPLTVLREAGITACPRCAAIHGSEDRFCPNCGFSIARNVELPIAGAATPAPAPGVGAQTASPALGPGVGAQAAASQVATAAPRPAAPMQATAPEPATVQPPGVQPPGAQAPGAQPPGAQPPGALAPGVQPPGALAPTAQPTTQVFSAQPTGAHPLAAQPPSAGAPAPQPPGILAQSSVAAPAAASPPAPAAQQTPSPAPVAAAPPAGVARSPRPPARDDVEEPGEATEILRPHAGGS